MDETTDSGRRSRGIWRNHRDFGQYSDRVEPENAQSAPIQELTCVQRGILMTCIERSTLRSTNKSSRNLTKVASGGRHITIACTFICRDLYSPIYIRQLRDRINARLSQATSLATHTRCQSLEQPHPHATSTWLQLTCKHSCLLILLLLRAFI